FFKKGDVNSLCLLHTHSSASLYNEEPTLEGIWKDIKAKDKRLPYDVIQYLNAVDAVCRAAETEGRSTIPQPYSKRDLIDLIVDHSSSTSAITWEKAHRKWHPRANRESLGRLNELGP
ncbi:hypothetical protein lerEdw1_007979, partial [Lerista edwardsae]